MVLIHENLTSIWVIQINCRTATLPYCPMPLRASAIVKDTLVLIICTCHPVSWTFKCEFTKWIGKLLSHTVDMEYNNTNRTCFYFSNGSVYIKYGVLLLDL